MPPSPSPPPVLVLGEALELPPAPSWKMGRKAARSPIPASRPGRFREPQPFLQDGGNGKIPGRAFTRAGLMGKHFGKPFSCSILSGHAPGTQLWPRHGCARSTAAVPGPCPSLPRGDGRGRAGFGMRGKGRRIPTGLADPRSRPCPGLWGWDGRKLGFPRRGAACCPGHRERGMSRFSKERF